MQTKEQTVSGEQNPQKETEGSMLKKDEVIFNLDEDGKAMPEKVKIDVYDKVLDDEILLTTLELDNALSLHESIEQAKKRLHDSSMVDIIKLGKRVEELVNLPKMTDAQIELLTKTQKDLKEKEETLNKICYETDTKLTAFKIKVKESRQDLFALEKKRDDTTKIKYIMATPCFVAEAYKYFAKHMYKKKDEWIEPTEEDSSEYISYLLAGHVSEPKLSVEEWEKSHPNMRLACKDAIATISLYSKRSPKEILVENRRSEKLKNIIGEKKKQAED